MNNLLWLIGGVVFGFICGGLFTSAMIKRLFSDDYDLNDSSISPQGLPIDEDYGKVKKK